MAADLWAYEAWPSRAGEGWGANAEVGDGAYDKIDFHVDLGCGRVPKGRIGVDRFAAAGVAIVADLDDPEHGAYTWQVAERPGGDAVLGAGGPHDGLPFMESSIKSIVSHHCFEHIGEGFMPLIEECYRVLEPGGILRAITPLFPSRSAVEDPDHCRYFMEGTWEAFGGTPGDTPQNCWMASFAVPYSNARFTVVDKVTTPRKPDPSKWWGEEDVREIRVALRAEK